MPSNNNKKDFSPKIFNNGKEKITLTNIDNNKENIRPADRNKQSLTTLNWTPQNRLLGELFLTFREMILNESKF